MDVSHWAPINWHTVFFLLFSIVACVFGVAVVLSSNIVRMALYLIVSLGATAGLFFLAGADFVGSMQLLIYVGGTLVLLVFGVMLTAQGPFVSMKTGGGDWILACLLSGCLLAILVPAGFSVSAWQNQPGTPPTTRQPASVKPAEGYSSHAPLPARLVSTAAPDESPDSAEPQDAASREVVQRNTAARIGMGLLGARVDKLDSGANPLTGGMAGYLLPFEIVSVHLLVVLIGAAYLARSKKRAAGASEGS